MINILIVYGTVEGQTAKISNAMASELRRLGHVVDVVNATELSKAPEVKTYDGVIVGAPIHMGKYPEELRNWVKTNASLLSEKPSAFFSVCLGILEKTNAKAQNAERTFVEDFFSWSNWRPAQWSILPGALLYSKYSWFKRLLMKAITKRAGQTTDTHRDYEYTDWNEVKTFADEFSGRVMNSIHKKIQPLASSQ